MPKPKGAGIRRLAPSPFTKGNAKKSPSDRFDRVIDAREGPRLLEGGSGPQHQRILAKGTDDLKPGRQPRRGQAAGNGNSRLLRDVERVGKGRPARPIFAVSAMFG